jgi:hypothetical protein
VERPEPVRNEPGDETIGRLNRCELVTRRDATGDVCRWRDRALRIAATSNPADLSRRTAGTLQDAPCAAFARSDDSWLADWSVNSLRVQTGS